MLWRATCLIVRPSASRRAGGALRAELFRIDVRWSPLCCVERSFGSVSVWRIWIGWPAGRVVEWLDVTKSGFERHV